MPCPPASRKQMPILVTTDARIGPWRRLRSPSPLPGEQPSQSQGRARTNGVAFEHEIWYKSRWMVLISQHSGDDAANISVTWLWVLKEVLDEL